jgi:hypothetical protein
LLSSSPVTAAEAVRLRATGRAGTVADMVGIGTDIAAANTTRYGDISLVGRSLNELGIKDLREPMVLPSTNETQALNQREGWKRLAEMVPGLTVTSVIGKIDDTQGTVAEYADYVRGSLGGGAGVIAGVENGNEPNAPKRYWNHDDEYGWVPLVRKRQEQMAREFGGGSGLEAIDVLGPSLSGGKAPLQYQRLGDISAHLDVGNFHLYPGNTEAGMPSDELDDVISGIKNNIGDAPYWCTEVGMHQGRDSSAGMAFYPEEVAAEYIARIPLEHFNRGVSRVYLYELLDQRPDPEHVDSKAHFGLVRATDPPTQKPAFQTVQRLLSLLRDSGPSFTPSGRSLTLRGVPADCRYVVLEKSDSRRYLCLWRDVQLWDLREERAVAVNPVQVDVELDRPAGVRKYIPSASADPVSTRATVSRMSVELAESVVILELT